MAGFLKPLRIEEIPNDDRRWRLLEPCVYYLKEPRGIEWVEADVNFITDFGSIPRPLWWIRGLSPFGRYRRAYVIHDKLFTAPKIQTRWSSRLCGFREANRILREAMQVLGAGRLIRGVVWSGVTSGGWIAWTRYRRQDAVAQARADKQRKRDDDCHG